MAEGLSPTEVGKEIEEGIQEAAEEAAGQSRGDRIATIAEAVLLALVALLTAWSGFAAAKWGTESSLQLSKASAIRVAANQANVDAVTDKNFDAGTFNTWFNAFTAKDQRAMMLAERRFRPDFRPAFDAWLAADPENNPNAPADPMYLPEYAEPGLRQARVLDARATKTYAAGLTYGARSDSYVQTTVFLASVLFLVGISRHFGVRGARYGLVILSICIVAFAIYRLIDLPKPPT